MRYSRLMIVMLFSVMPMACAKERTEDVDAEVRRQLDAARGKEDMLRDATRPMLGVWVVDLDATLGANPDIDDAFRKEMRAEILRNPFELLITPQEYVSRGPVMIRKDRYTVVDAEPDGSSVLIRLEAAEGVDVGQERLARLTLHENRLSINLLSPMTVVMMRKPADGPAGR